METLEAFFAKNPGLCLLLIMGSVLAYAAISLWLWHRKKNGSGQEVVTPDWAKSLPPVYTAANVRKGQDYWIWCVDTRKAQHFHVRDVQGNSMYVRINDDNGTVCEGWATEIRSGTFLHHHHLLKRVPKEPLAA